MSTAFLLVLLACGLFWLSGNTTAYAAFDGAVLAVFGLAALLLAVATSRR